MEMHGIPSARIVAFQSECVGRLQIRECEVIYSDGFIRPSNTMESSVRNIHVQRVHEHDVPAPGRIGCFRRHFHVPCQIGHVDLQVRGRRNVVVCQRTIKNDPSALDGLNPYQIV